MQTLADTTPKLLYTSTNAHHGLNTPPTWQAREDTSHNFKHPLDFQPPPTTTHHQAITKPTKDIMINTPIDYSLWAYIILACILNFLINKDYKHLLFILTILLKCLHTNYTSYTKLKHLALPIYRNTTPTPTPPQRKTHNKHITTPQPNQPYPKKQKKKRYTTPPNLTYAKLLLFILITLNNPTKNTPSTTHINSHITLRIHKCIVDHTQPHTNNPTITPTNHKCQNTPLTVKSMSVITYIYEPNPTKLHKPNTIQNDPPIITNQQITCTHIHTTPIQNTPPTPQTLPQIHLQKTTNNYLLRTNLIMSTFYNIKHAHHKHPKMIITTTYTTYLQTLIFLGGNIEANP